MCYNIIMGEDLDVSHVRGDKSTMVRLDKRWQATVMKRDRMPKTFDLTKREWKEYKKNLGEKPTRKAHGGLSLFRGARVIIR